MFDIGPSVGLFFASSIVSAAVFTVARNTPEVAYKPILIKGYNKVKHLFVK